jgi:ABC-type microcin C transport system duplicated ATPase subunit YejF
VTTKLRMKPCRAVDAEVVLVAKDRDHELGLGPFVGLALASRAALAVREVEHVLDLIRELRRQNIAVILISHRLTDVFEVSDRIITLRQGE